MREDRVQFKFNLPENVKAWLVHEAARNLRSQSAEVTLALLEKMARTCETEKAHRNSDPIASHAQSTNGGVTQLAEAIQACFDAESGRPCLRQDLVAGAGAE